MAHLGFAALKAKLATKGADDPGALAAYIGRKKMGADAFQRAAEAGRRRAEKAKKKGGA